MSRPQIIPPSGWRPLGLPGSKVDEIRALPTDTPDEELITRFRELAGLTPDGSSLNDRHAFQLRVSDAWEKVTAEYNAALQAAKQTEQASNA